MTQIITFSKVMVMYFYAMKIIKFGATCTSDLLFRKITFVLYLHFLLRPSFQPVFNED